MLSTTYSVALSGIEGTLVNVEVDVGNGLPSWDIVGLPDAVVRESKERVRTAIKNSDLILVLEQGKVVERGDHDDLLAQKGKYSQLYTNMIELS